MSPHILALDIAGAPHRWITVRDAACYYATDMVAWAIGTSEFVLRGGTQRSTGRRSLIRASSIIAIKGKDFVVRHYLEQYEEAAEQSAGQGFLLHRDRKEVIDLAKAASVPQGAASNAEIIPDP
jgi:hypothetical protein